MESLRDLAARIDALSVRERALTMAVLLFGLYVIWDAALIGPLVKEEKALEKKRAALRAETVELAVEKAQIVAREDEDPDAENRALLARLETDLQAVKAELREAAQHLVLPDQMASVLEAVLARSRGVEFLGLKGLGASSILSNDEDAESEEGARATPKEGTAADRLGSAFKHGLRFEFEGGYLETLALLRELESLPWGFFWDAVNLEVIEYPRSKVSITVFTLSWTKDWIGV